MPQALFVVKKYTGPTAANVSVVGNNLISYLSVDQHSTATGSYPVAAPRLAGVNNYSYENWLRLYCTVAPTSECANFKFYGPNSQPDIPSNKLTVYDNSTPDPRTPIQTQSIVCRFRQDTTHFDYNNSLTIGTPQTDDVITAVGQYTDYLVLQLKVDQGAASGVIALQTYTITYDET